MAEDKAELAKLLFVDEPQKEPPPSLDPEALSDAWNEYIHQDAMVEFSTAEYSGLAVGDHVRMNDGVSPDKRYEIVKVENNGFTMKVKAVEKDDRLAEKDPHEIKYLKGIFKEPSREDGPGWFQKMFEGQWTFDDRSK